MKPAQKPRTITRKTVAGRNSASDTDEDNDVTIIHEDSITDDDVTTPDRHARRGATEVGKRKRSARVVLDEGDMEDDSVDTDRATTAIASGAGAPQDEHRHRAANPPRSTDGRAYTKRPRLPFNTQARYLDTEAEEIDVDARIDARQDTDFDDYCRGTADKKFTDIIEGIVDASDEITAYIQVT